MVSEKYKDRWKWMLPGLRPRSRTPPFFFEGGFTPNPNPNPAPRPSIQNRPVRPSLGGARGEAPLTPGAGRSS